MSLLKIFESAVVKLNEGILDSPDKFMGKLSPNKSYDDDFDSNYGYDEDDLNPEQGVLPTEIGDIENVTEEYLNNFLNYHGWDGFNNKKEALNHINYLVQYEYKPIGKLNELVLYRVIAIEYEHLVNKDKLGSHWTRDKRLLDDSDFLDSIGLYGYLKSELYTVTVKVNPKIDIDWDFTIKNNLMNPDEEEITLKNFGSSAKLISVEKLQD